MLKIKDIEDLRDLKIEGVPYPMVYVEGGGFMMGSTEYDDEQPIHKVIVPSYYM